MTEDRKPATRSASPQTQTGPGGVRLNIKEVKEWIGGLYIELQLARTQMAEYQRQASDYQKALAIARAELEQQREGSARRSVSG